MAIMLQDSMANTPQLFTQIPYFIKGKGLTSTDKIVFGTIYTMLNINRVCYMNNQTIAKNVEVSERSVSRSIAKLKQKGLLEVHLIYKKGSKEVDKRYINLPKSMFKDVGTPMTQMSPPPTKNCLEGIDTDGEGNRLFNRLSNNNKGSLKSYFDVWDEPNKLIQNKLLKLIEKHGQKLFDYAVIKTAEVNATKNSSYNYMSSLLSDWSKHGVTDVSKAKAYVEQRKAKRKPKKSNYSHTPKKEKLPEWATKTPEERKAERDKQKAEHKYKMEHDPEYRKKQEQSEQEQSDMLEKIRSWRKDADA
ncbi:helix-turn-helix domain-containing protein (plasmid) [Apilactobacillus apisilvae]|uniref:Helix-turn-helix domain-containing protein n=1 Tax=Apilactobacillus apisilvae TaxID=2923364 RepID=A0ABY4PIZ1_9LACO|nr:helix-turn-helix domain-containing protein [Apilactobacillus apisilvae]UQS85841.1 helix-turn-helix domain-containing protein [Apilactobacillus apisilvae]